MKKNHNKLNVLISLVLGAVVTTTGFLIAKMPMRIIKQVKKLNS